MYSIPWLRVQNARYRLLALLRSPTRKSATYIIRSQCITKASICPYYSKKLCDTQCSVLALTQTIHTCARTLEAQARFMNSFAPRNILYRTESYLSQNGKVGKSEFLWKWFIGNPKIRRSKAHTRHTMSAVTGERTLRARFDDNLPFSTGDHASSGAQCFFVANFSVYG